LIQYVSVMYSMPGYASTVLPNLSQHKVSLSQRVGTHRSGTHSLKRHIIQGIKNQKRNIQGHIVQGFYCRLNPLIYVYLGQRNTVEKYRKTQYELLRCRDF
jgi:hypothetical protein